MREKILSRGMSTKCLDEKGANITGEVAGGEVSVRSDVSGSVALGGKEMSAGGYDCPSKTYQRRAPLKDLGRAITL